MKQEQEQEQKPLLYNFRPDIQHKAGVTKERKETPYCFSMSWSLRYVSVAAFILLFLGKGSKNLKAQKYELKPYP